MFRLEKVFQNDDKAFILFCNLIYSILILVSNYIFITLADNSIFELSNFKIFKNSPYFVYSFIFSLIYFVNSFFFYNKKKYKTDFKYFFSEIFLNFIFSLSITLIIIFLFKINFLLDLKFIFILMNNLIIFFITKIYFNYIYQKLIDKNIIQKNVMLVGNYQKIRQILNEKFDKILVFKCCIILDTNNLNLKFVKSELKIPVFSENDDLRSILEYHELGQIWIIEGHKNKSNVEKSILNYSVDTLNVRVDKVSNKKNKDLLANKYEYDFYAMSRFHGVNFFLKILTDKILSLFFLLIASPILIFSIIAIYIEDGVPVIFSQNRTGWDGRRFKLYKLRTLYNGKYDPKIQVSKNDKRKLKIGTFLRKYSIDEIPQLFNVLLGDMSLVGPRPHPVSLDLSYNEIYSNFLTRYKGNPGLTGWAQIHGLRGSTKDPERMKKRMDYDLWYLNNWTIWLDIFIIIKTFYAIIKFKGE